MTLYKWSQTASADAAADSTINWAEGQSPSSVNDSARAMMAAIAKHRDDIAGAIVTSGTSTAYAVASYQQFDSPAHLNGQAIAFTPHATNGATVTLNVDGLGAKPLRSAPSIELPAGVLVQGTPYVALYNNSDQAFYLQGLFGNPYNVPIGGMMDFIGPTAPNSSFVVPIGQPISRTTYATLFAMVGTTYGVGDGSTTFNLPDLRGRVVACFDNGNITGRLNSGGINAALLGSAGGEQTHTLTVAELAAHTHANSLIDPGHAHGYTAPFRAGWEANGNGAGLTANTTPATTTASGTGVTISNASAGSGNAHNNVQPTIVLSKILRII